MSCFTVLSSFDIPSFVIHSTFDFRHSTFSIDFMTAKYVIGIDLGTTNSVLAYAPLDAERPQVELLPIPQLVAAGDGRVADDAAVVSLSGQRARGGRRGASICRGPTGREFAVGEFARRQAAEVPDRTVAAAKSWLCHSRVDRRQPILPWNAPAEVPKVSPVDGLAALPRTSGRRVGSRPSRRAAGRAARRADRAGLVRRQRPRADPRGRAGRRAARRPGAAGRAAGGRLRLAGRHRRPLAAAAYGRRHAAGLRRRRRHDRPDAGRRGRGARRAGAAADRRRQSSAGRRRQHGPGPGPSRGRPVRRKGRASSIPGNRSPCGIRAARPRKRCSTPGGPETHTHLGPRPRPQADRRHGLGRSRSPRA